MKVDYSILTNYGNYRNLEKYLGVSLLEYNMSDVENLCDILVKFRRMLAREDKIELNSCMTLAALTFKDYRRNYMTNDTYIMNDSKDMNRYEFLRNGYKGGIVDVYKPVGYNMTALDINSLYPSAMRNNDMPVGYGEWVKDLNNIDISNFFGFLEVTVCVPEDEYMPLLGIKLEGRLTYPTGTFITTVFSEELKLAISEGVKVEKVHSALKFERGRIFKKYINTLYKRRLKCIENGDSVGSYVLKIRMNSSYGR